MGGINFATQQLVEGGITSKNDGLVCPLNAPGQEHGQFNEKFQEFSIG